MMKIYRYPKQSDWAELVQRPAGDSTETLSVVTEILRSVQTKGDNAVRKYSKLFDGFHSGSLELSLDDLHKTANRIDPTLRQAIETAYTNIDTFHRAQVRPEVCIETTPGVTCWRRAVPIERVGLYIPGGSAPLFSTLLMLAVPASIAGCRHIILCTPPDRNGSIDPAVAFTALMTGIDRIYLIGGAQAIAAMAFGTELVPKVDKILGPGNKYVTCAKQLVSQQGTAIDFPAGPSELVVLADSYCEPRFIAADLLSQAEHGPDSQVSLISSDEEVIEQTIDEVNRQLLLLPRQDIARRALSESRAILVNTIQEGVAIINEYAPEHLIIACKEDELIALEVRNAGSVFLGNYSPESAGDYASGTNHTLPTGGYARMFGGVSVESFFKYMTIQKLTRDGLARLSDAIIPMAEAEGLRAHSNAVRVRVEK